MSVAADAKEFFDASGVTTENTYVTASMLDTKGTVGSHFVDVYMQKFGVLPDGFAANGYDALKLIVQSVETCKKEVKVNECIKNNLYSTKDFQGAGGNLTFDVNGDVSKSVIVKKAEEGTFKSVQ